jgi:flagellar M-ring protein FliF
LAEASHRQKAAVSQFVENLRGLGPGKLAALGAVVAVTLGLMAWLAASMTKPTMTLLYGGLEPSVAGEVIRQLDELRVPHEVQGDAILVPSAERDRVRMALAEMGLPRRGQAGYELLDQLGRFGTTTDMFNAAYWRAKEGELARTIDWLSNVKDARVHLVPLAREPFSRTSVEPSASITVTTEDGAPLSRRQAQAMRHLVALGVKGLRPERITVIDAVAGIVLGPELEDGVASTQSLQAEREQRLQTEIEEMLAAHVGHGRVRVSVAVALNHEAETVTERLFDPETQVAVHRDTTEIEESSSEAEGAAAVSVAGNLPRPEPAAGPTDSAQSARTETREVTNFEVSEVRRERQRPAGDIKRISVAVLLGGTWEPSGDGPPTWRPQSAAEITAIRNLVESAIGFDAERGDKVTVETLPLQPASGTSATDVAPGLFPLLLGQLRHLMHALALVAVAFLVIWYVARPILSAQSKPGDQQPALAANASPASLEGRPAAATKTQRLPAPQQGGAAGHLIAPAAEGEVTPHERAVVALVDAVDRHPDEALGTLRRWLKDGVREEAA